MVFFGGGRKGGFLDVYNGYIETFIIMRILLFMASLIQGYIV